MFSQAILRLGRILCRAWQQCWIRSRFRILRILRVKTVSIILSSLYLHMRTDLEL